jgi:hypothetical protein
MKYKTIRVTESTHERLTKLGNKGESFDKIINKVLDEIEKKD